MKKFAVFDIDGTLVRWQLYHAIADAMVKLGYISKQDFAAVRAARMEWKERAHEESFVAYERKLIAAFDTAIIQTSPDEFTRIVQGVYDEYHAQVYTYTRNLIDELRAKGYVLLAISGSPEQIVKLVAGNYGFDAFCASTYEQKNGKFTGNKYIAALDKKSALTDLIKKHQLVTHGSIGVGDTASDIPMLEMVSQPIALNPTIQLYEHAREQNWKIVVERKNVVYQLEETNGTYILA